MDKPGTGHNIRGEIYEVDLQMLGKLDELEDHPNYYERRPEKVLKGSGDSKEGNWLRWQLSLFVSVLLQRLSVGSTSWRSTRRRCCPCPCWPSTGPRRTTGGPTCPGATGRTSPTITETLWPHRTNEERWLQIQNICRCRWDARHLYKSFRPSV